MIKMNFENKLENDDEQLIHILKEEVKEFPSEELVERTMTKISSMQSEGRFEYKPLRIPLYIMTAIALLLLAPVVIPTVPRGSYSISFPELSTYSESLIVRYAVWWWLAAVALSIFRILFQVQSKVNSKSI